jgi:hypothetical protein
MAAMNRPRSPAAPIFSLLLLFAGCCAHAPSSSSRPVAASTAAPSARTPASPEPATADGCRACGGDWSIHGLIQRPSCLCPTSDGGKRCRDGDECQGPCLADEGEREVTQPGPPARGYFVGKCARVRTSFGCHRSIAAGAIKAGPISLDEPPAQICAD